MDYTLKQIAEKAKVNISTARFYRDKFEPYFRTVGEGRNRRYTEEINVDLLKFISKLYGEGLQSSQIVDSLEACYGYTVECDLPVVKENLTTQQDIIEGIRSMLVEELSSRDEAIEKLSHQVSELSQGSQDRDMLLMETLRKIEEKNQKKGWRFWR